jgi:hypothetical protein
MENYREWQSMDYLSNDPRVLLSHIFSLPPPLSSIPPSVALNDDVVLPHLRCISCPVRGCETPLSEDDLSCLSEYSDAYSSALIRLDERRAYRTCCLQDTLNCTPDSLPLEELVCLGCSHFYHPDCFLHYVKSTLSSCQQSKSQLVCYQCKVSQHSCDCIECANRMDLSVIGEHVITEGDLLSMRRLLLGEDINGRKRSNGAGDKQGRGEGGRIGGAQEGQYKREAIEGLIKVWAAHSIDVSVAAVALASESVILRCVCGSSYVVERPAGHMSSDQGGGHHSIDMESNVRMNKSKVLFSGEGGVGEGEMKEGWRGDQAYDDRRGVSVSLSAHGSELKSSGEEAESGREMGMMKEAEKGTAQTRQQQHPLSLRCVNQSCQRLYCMEVYRHLLYLHSHQFLIALFDLFFRYCYCYFCVIFVS